MAVLTNLKSAELAEDYRGNPRNDHGKVRMMHFTITALAAQADAGSEIELGDIPFGSIRVIPSLSKITHSAAGAGALIDVGHRAYRKADGLLDDTEIEAEDLDAFTPNGPIDVQNAGEGVALDALNRFDVHSKAGIRVVLSNSGAALPAGFTASGYIAYIAE